MLTFLVGKDSPSSKFSVTYDEYGFDAEPHPNGGFTSIQINYLQIEVDADGELLYAWGLCPEVGSRLTAERPRDFISRKVTVKTDKEVIPGVSILLAKNWPVYVNPEERWVCVGEPARFSSLSVAVQFAPNSIVVLEDGQLVGLWLRPTSLPE